MKVRLTTVSATGLELTIADPLVLGDAIEKALDLAEFSGSEKGKNEFPPTLIRLYDGKKVILSIRIFAGGLLEKTYSNRQ